MAEQQQYSVNPTEFDSILHTDNDPSKQPKNTHRFALNAVDEAYDGQRRSLSNERANYACTTRPSGYEIIGNRYLEDDTSVLILTNPVTSQDEIALIKKDNLYYTQLNTSVLDLDITHQCDIIYRLRRGRERVIYWTDGKNQAKTFNLDRPHNFYNQTYKAYLQAGGDPDTFVGEKWDIASFNLIKSYSSIPFFNNVEIIETGSTLPGSYNFAIQYIDEDLNPTSWITTTNTVNIYNDSTTLPYPRIRGSRNVNTSTQSFPRASKSIKLTISNLDTSFPFYRIAIIRAAGNNGEAEKAFASELFSTSDGNFLYSGNDGSLTEISLTDILIDKEIIFAPQHIEQIENRLILANTKGKSVNWCEFQRFASKISSNLTTKEVILNDIISDPNVKNAKSTFMFRGYMPGEVYSFGVVYLFSDGTLSPAFHIPGKSLTNATSLMKVYELDTNRYLNIHNCSTNNYWGLDAQGNTLVAKKTRHHRFPFRKEVNKPLYTTIGGITVINKYRLRVTFGLNPAFAGPPTPNVYPLDVNNDPIVIPYILDYQVNGVPSTSSYAGNLVDTDMGVEIIIYDDTLPLDQISAPDYILLDPTTELAVTYQGGGTADRFIITHTYETYVASTSTNVDKSEIFGIEFGNIEKPHPDVVGFYIVRNERLEDDKIILDNAIFGSMTQYQQYKSFGLINPKQYYHVDNCGRPGDSGDTVNYYLDGSWFFSPEFEYLGKKLEFDTVEVEGTYTENTVNMPTISNNATSACNGGSGADGGTKGVYIDDVQAGTSYNPDINKAKDKDDDGFDLIIGYRNTMYSYAINNTFVFPAKRRILYLDSSSYQDMSGDIFYNASTDNRIGMYLFNTSIPSGTFYDPATKRNKLLYGSLVKNNLSAYANFINRPYYKEHNNPVMFGTNTIVNNVKIFNGDAMISGFNFVSTIFYDMVTANRAKKSNMWKIFIGALFGGGLLVAIAGKIAEVRRLQAMVETEYEKGLKKAVSDGGVFETLRTDLSTNDDTIRWFADRASNLYIESSISFGLRSGMTVGLTDFTDAPGPYDEPSFRSYLTEKLTSLDREQGSGRLYKGTATPEFYDMNPDYLRFNKQKQFSHLALEYDCCSDPNETFPLRRWFSEQSFQEERVDNYGVFLPNNYSDMEGEHGEITDMFRLGNNLYMHTKEALWQQPANLQERVTNEIVSFIGTGNFLSIPPRKVIDDSLGSGGTQHKWGTIKTNKGVFFINEIEGKVYLYGETPSVISSKGNINYFENNVKSFLSKQIFDRFGVNFLLDNNPANMNGIGYISTYDTRFDRIVFTKRDYLILPDKLALLTIVDIVPVSGTNFAYSTLTGLFYQGTSLVSFSDINYFQNKSLTMSYSFKGNNGKGGWIGWHSYIPNYYIHSQNNFYSVIAQDYNIYKHNLDSQFQTYYGVYHPFIVRYVPMTSVVEKIIEDLTILTKARRYNAVLKDYVDEHFITFNKILLSNSRQSTGEQVMVVKDTQGSPQDWYAQQIVNQAGVMLITRKERDWNINQFRDYIDNYTIPMFSKNWVDLASVYFMDEVMSPTVINLNKNWNEVLNFRDKYIVIQLKFDNFSDVNLILNYSLETEQISNR